MAIDFKQRLADQRTKEALDKKLHKIKSGGAPNLISFRGKREKVIEPPPPGIHELDMPDTDRKTLSQLVEKHTALGVMIGSLKKEQKGITDEIKPLCKLYTLSKFMSGETKANYYAITKSTIKKELLLAAGIPPAVIAKCTVTSTVYAFKATGPKGEDNSSDDSES